MSLLTRSLEDGDITILRLLWLCRGLDLMQGQRVWALSNIRVKELNAGGHRFYILMILQFLLIFTSKGTGFK